MVTMSHDVVISILFCNILQVLFDLHQTGNVAEHRTDFLHAPDVMCSTPKFSIAIIVTMHKHDDPAAFWPSTPRYTHDKLWYQTFSDNLMKCQNDQYFNKVS